MRLFDLNGNLATVDVRSSSFPPNIPNMSKLEKKAYDLLCEKYPRDTILYEFTIPGSRMSVDFIIFARKLALEVNGIQHSEFSSFFHGNKNMGNFAKQIKRDVKKAQWCEQNNLKLIDIFVEEDLKAI